MVENGGVILEQPSRGGGVGVLFSRRNSDQRIMQISQPLLPRLASPPLYLQFRVWPVVCSCGWTMWHASSWKTTVYSPARLPFQHQFYQLQTLELCSSIALEAQRLHSRGPKSQKPRQTLFTVLAAKFILFQAICHRFASLAKKDDFAVRIIHLFGQLWLLFIYQPAYIGFFGKDYIPYFSFSWTIGKWFSCPSLA